VRVFQGGAAGSRSYSGWTVAGPAGNPVAGKSFNGASGFAPWRSQGNLSAGFGQRHDRAGRGAADGVTVGAGEAAAVGVAGVVLRDDEAEAIGDENLPLIGSLILPPFDRENLPPRVIACVSISIL
jgi:hypothetical protein